MRQGELSLDQMLADPIVQLLMSRDGVAEADVRALMARLRQQRVEPEPEPAPRRGERDEGGRLTR